MFHLLWLHWVFLAACRLSLAAAMGVLFFAAVHRLLIAGASSRGAQASVAAARGLPGCGSRALEGVESTAWARWLLPPAACGIFETRDRTHVLCVGRRVLIHRTTRECGAMKPGIEPTSSAWAGGFSSTAPPESAEQRSTVLDQQQHRRRSCWRETFSSLSLDPLNLTLDSEAQKCVFYEVLQGILMHG